MAKKSDSHVISHENLLDYIMPFFNELMDQKDRGTAIVAAALLDDTLATMLRTFFVDQPDDVEKLLASDRPIGTFSARITLAYCLGLIDASLCRDLNTIRGIRNDFAHGHRPMTLNLKAYGIGARTRPLVPYSMPA